MKKLVSMIVIMSMIFTMCIGVYADGESSKVMNASHGATYVVKNDGSLWGWGLQYTGVGNAYKEKQITPKKIMDNVRSVSTGGSQSTVAVKKDNTIWAWGAFEGYPGRDGDSRPRYTLPTQLAIDDVNSVAVSRDFILALKNDGSLWACGEISLGNGTTEKADDTDGFKKITDDVIDMYATYNSVFYITSDKKLWGYGYNAKAELGNGTDTGDGLGDTNTHYTAKVILDDVRYVTGDPDGSVMMAVRTDNSLYAWANNGFYTEAFGWVEDAGKPYKAMDNVKTCAVDGDSGFVVKTDHTLWGWGYSYQGNTVRNEQVPYLITENVQSISLGERHAAIVKMDNTLWTMGGNYRSGLGYDSDEVWYTPLTKIVEDVQDAPASWATEYVEKAIGMQLIPEDMQGKYSQTINREEFCILAVRLIEKKSGMAIEDYISLRGLEMESTDTFTDTNNKVIFAAKTLGITKGTSDTTFSPKNLLTREQAATFLSNTAKAVGQEITAETPTYADLEEIAGWARPFTGYVYNIGVMRGVGNNKFDPKGGYQRQAAYITMYKLFESIDAVSTEKIASHSEVKDPVKVSSLDDIKSDISSIQPLTFTATIEGTSKSPEETKALKFDAYFRNTDVRLDTYWDGKKVSKAIYNEDKDQTYVESMLYTHYGELTSGNLLPFTLLDVKYLEALEIDDENEFFSASYDELEGEKVLYVKTSIKNGVTTEFWYSLKYLIPIKFYQVFNNDDSKDIISWQVVDIKDNASLTDETFKIPDDMVATKSAEDYFGEDKTTRELLLYASNRIETEEVGLMDMTQIVYYSSKNYDDLVTYFDDLMKGSEGYSLDKFDNKAIIEGTVNEDTVIVIVNDHKTSEGNSENGININYYQ